MYHPIKSPRKLIEVALPLDVINAACAAEKLIKVGKPTNLHLWWARRPLAAARAVIFAQFVNDPCGLWEAQNPDKRPNSQQRSAWTRRRKELFDLIEKLVKWENTANEEVLKPARAEIRRSWRDVCELNKDHPQAAELFDADKLPALHDPFAGGGVIPLEAQRLGLQAYASDLNPVAVLITKAMIEIPAKFAGRLPISLGRRREHANDELALEKAWPDSNGLAEDIRHYGAWMRSEAQKRIGHLYPPVEVTTEMARERPDLRPLIGQKLEVIAWIWARTVKSPNPAFSHVDVPLVSSFILSTKAGKEVYVQPIVEGDCYRFIIKLGTPPPEAEKGTKLARGANFRCILSDAAIEPNYIKGEGIAKRMDARLIAVVTEGPRGRVYLAPTGEMDAIARSAEPGWQPEGSLVEDARAFTPTLYGLKDWCDLFTPRQLVALTTFSDLVAETREKIRHDAIAAGLSDDRQSLDSGGINASAYAEAVSVYLAFAMTRMADWGNSLSRWESTAQVPQQLFARQAIPMVWDFCETNMLSQSTGSYTASIANIVASFKKSSAERVMAGTALQADAQTQSISKGKFISTDPPYYDNIPYADLSDFFYLWLRRALRSTYPILLSTIAVPKIEELVATSYRHGGKDEAESFFLKGMTSAMHSLANQAHPEAPITIYYAFKQSETSDESGTISTGWVTFLDAVIRAGLRLSGTWPLRTENSSRMRGQSSNALASSIVLVCRKRLEDAPTISRREFLRELNALLPEALDEMIKGTSDDRSPVAPVDLSQAIIGPGMAVFSKYAAVLEADGSPMSVRTALQVINRFLAEDDFDADTQFCLRWFEQRGWTESAFGEADVLARSKSTSVDTMKEAGVLQSGSGKVRLLKWAEYRTDWDPRTDARIPIWKALHQLIRALKQGGESASGALLAAIGGKAEAVRQLAYRLYTICERLGKAEEARAYNELITSWTSIESAAATAPKPTDSLLPGFEN